MNINPWREWAGKAASHIKYAPDRGGVIRELMDHMEDKAEALKARGVPEEAAAKAALDSMGDPDEVGAELAAVHKPWLGRLWDVSRTILILSIVAAVLVGGYRLMVHLMYPDAYTERSPFFWQAVEETDKHTTVVWLDADCKDRSDGYTFTVPHAILEYTEAYTRWDGAEIEAGRRLRLVMEANWWNPLKEEPGAFQRFYAVDDRGTVYADTWEQGGQYDPAFVGNVYRTGLMSAEYDAWFANLDPEAQWVELRYDRDGRDVRLRIDLTGGEPG